MIFNNSSEITASNLLPSTIDFEINRIRYLFTSSKAKQDGYPSLYVTSSPYDLTKILFKECEEILSKGGLAESAIREETLEFVKEFYEKYLPKNNDPRFNVSFSLNIHTVSFLETTNPKNYIELVLKELEMADSVYVGRLQLYAREITPSNLF